MTTKETLIAVKAMIEDPQNWWDGTPGKGVTRNCPGTALFRVDGWETQGAEECMLKVIGNGANIEQLYKFNDTHTHDEVMAMMDKAIGLCND